MKYAAQCLQTFGSSIIKHAVLDQGASELDVTFLHTFLSSKFHDDVLNALVNGPVDSNHGNILTTANFLVLWHYGVPHYELNSTE